jgi:hypothetical protein
MIPSSIKGQEVPLKMVGGNNYGRFDKISDERTYNMIRSDAGLVPYPGYRMVASINPGSRGRHMYSSSRWGNSIAVIGNAVYGVSPPAAGTEFLSYFFIGNINTFVGDVFIDENIVGQIGICDGQDIWIYNWSAPTTPALIAVTLPIDSQTNAPIVPGYITYQSGRFITGNKETANWFLSAVGNGANWNPNSGFPLFAAIQSKPTNFVAALRAPGRGNLLYVFGQDVVELWYDVGAAIFPYQRSTSVSIDYGCLSPNTIAAMDTIVAWLGVNERSGPVIMVSAGSDITKISDDGIDFQLAQLTNPAASTGLFFKESGHLFYQITFFDPADNFTLVYDFNNKEFYSASDENMNYHVAENVAFMQDSYYFVSINDGNIYQTSSRLTTYDYTVPNSGFPVVYEIPRVRICPPLRLGDSSRFVMNSLTFTVEQGNDANYAGSLLYYLSEENGTVLCEEDGNATDASGIYLSQERVVNPYVPRIDISVSTDGGETFSSYSTQELNPLGQRKNRVIFWQLGSANDATFQFRFWGLGRAVVFDGIVNIYQ